MMQPLTALLIALGPFLYFFGMKGFVLIGLPLIYVPGEWQTRLALLSLAVGLFLAWVLWQCEPDSRKTMVLQVALLLAGEVVLAFIV